MAYVKRRRQGWELPDREVTDEGLYLNRRAFLGASAAMSAGLVLGGCETADGASGPEGDAYAELSGVRKSELSTAEEPTRHKDATSYNNFYEFGTDKSDPARYAGSLVTDPWSIAVGGAVHKPGKIGIEDVLKIAPLEERIYRLRCVEAWSMVIPWVGIPLSAFLQRFDPTGDAKYVGFKTLYDPEQMPGQSRRVLDWPYQEGLRLDEAMHPLTILAVGMYGHVLPNQNGAPVRLVVPWKYGFKSIKSIVSIDLTVGEPATSWNVSAPREYGFYANVNPKVDHPRWSQGTERRIGEFRRRDTQMFNGYGEQVAGLYKGMDLSRFY